MCGQKGNLNSASAFQVVQDHDTTCNITHYNGYIIQGYITLALYITTYIALVIWHQQVAHCVMMRNEKGICVICVMIFSEIA